jgi:Domain of unknown function (DUF4169)
LNTTIEWANVRCATLVLGFAQQNSLLWSGRFSPSCFVMETGMGDIVNLKRFKKRVTRDQSAKQAEVNRARFGRTESERASDERRAKHASDFLDQHHIDAGDAS